MATKHLWYSAQDLSQAKMLVGIVCLPASVLEILNKIIWCYQKHQEAKNPHVL